MFHLIMAIENVKKHKEHLPLEVADPQTYVHPLAPYAVKAKCISKIA